jgi:xanthine dehydrogenase accessory factor
MNDLYQKLIERIEEGRACVLATVIRQSGPAPRGVGAKCLIDEAGLVSGTVGGGILEARTIEDARRVLETSLPHRIRFTLKGTDVADTDMLCGGDVELFLEPAAMSGPEGIDLYRKLLRVGARGGAGVLATLLDRASWEGGRLPKIFVQKDGESTGGFSGFQGIEAGLRERLGHILGSRSPGVLFLPGPGGDRTEVFVEPLISAPVLYIFGGGHVARQIVPLAGRVGFHVEVVDDRAEFSNPADFPEAGAVHRLPFDQVMAHLPVDADSYLVIVTRGHLHDKEVLAQALKTPARYLGMIGSRRKRDAIYEKLLEEGFTREDLSRVHSPIGLEIGAETPEEIAVSIVAELIQMRARKGER